MKKSQNTPYTRSSGIEITKQEPYLNSGDNRQKRRHKEPPFIGNGKNIPLVVTKTGKYRKHIQIDSKTGKKIYQYLAA